MNIAVTTTAAQPIGFHSHYFRETLVGEIENCEISREIEPKIFNNNVGIDQFFNVKKKKEERMNEFQKIGIA